MTPSSLSSDLGGTDIRQLLDSLASEPLSDGIRDLYDAAYKNVSTHPEHSIELGQKALKTLDRLYSIPLADSNALTYDKGRCHLLIASIYLDQERYLTDAYEHFSRGRDEFHSRQWSHLESLAYLGLGVSSRKLKDLREALIALKSAHDSLEHESIPDRIDTTYLRTAIEKETLTIQGAFSQESDSVTIRIPIVSDIAAGLGWIPQENVEEYLYLSESECRGADFAVRVQGDSMKGHGIFPGDIALIRKQPHVELAEIAAVVIMTPTESLGVLKQYFVESRADLRHWLLKSSNPTSEHLVVIPPGGNTGAIRSIYQRAIRKGIISSSIVYYEDSQLKIAGKFVQSLRSS